MAYGAHIFVAEDDDDDRLLLEEAFDDVDGSVQIEFAQDGIDLLEKLNSQYVGESPLIIIDLNMPRMSGHDTLRALRAHPVYSKTPVVVLSTSDAPSDIDVAYALGANTFFTKPATYKDLVEVVRSVSQYWQLHAKFPRVSNTSETA